MPQPPRRIQGPDGNVHEFPADFTDADIEAAFASLSMPESGTTPVPERPQHPYARLGRGAMDLASNNLSTLGGIAGGLIGGVVGNVPGAVAGAALGAGGGEGWQQVVDYFRGKPTPQTELGVVGKVAKEAATSGASELVGAGLAKGMVKTAPWLMTKAVKPATSLLKEYKTTAPKLVQTLLDEGVNVTQGGIEKLQRLFDATNDKIAEALTAREALVTRLHGTPDTITRPNVAARVLDTAQRATHQVDPASDLKAIGGVVERFLDPPVNAGNLSLTNAQKMKIGTYQKIGKAYGEMSSAEKEAQKALARGLKEEIAAEVPSITALNQRDSELMAALDAVGRRVALNGGKDPVGFAWVTGHPTTFIAALMDRSPLVKSFLARGLYSQAARAAGGRVSPQLIKAAVAALASHETAAPPTDTP